MNVIYFKSVDVFDIYSHSLCNIVSNLAVW